MIKNDEAYKKAKRGLEKGKQELEKQKEMLIRDNLTPEQIERVLIIQEMHLKQLEGEIVEYENYQQGNFQYDDFNEDIGRYLIACRIYQNISQQELAKLLGVTPQQVSRDERNEYKGASYERIKRVAKALKVNVTFEMERSFA